MQPKKVGTFLSSCCPGMSFKDIKKLIVQRVRAGSFLGGFKRNDI